MDSDGETSEIEDEHKPTVGVGLVGMVFPFEDEPEHDGGKGRRIGINLALHSREPERVAPGVGQSTGQTGTHDDDGLPG